MGCSVVEGPVGRPKAGCLNQREDLVDHVADPVDGTVSAQSEVCRSVPVTSDCQRVGILRFEGRDEGTLDDAHTLCTASPSNTTRPWFHFARMTPSFMAVIVAFIRLPYKSLNV